MSINWQVINREQYYPLLAIVSPLTERYYLIREIANRFGLGRSLYFWNRGYQCLQKVVIEAEKISFYAAEWKLLENPIRFCSTLDRAGIFIIEGIQKVDEEIHYQLENAFFNLQQHLERQIILVSDRIDLPVSLYPIIPQLKNNLPNLEEIEAILNKQIDDATEIDEKLVQACGGLPRGEIELLLVRGQTRRSDLVSLVLEYKKNKLAGRGLNLLPEPDVKDVGGLDLLDRDLNKIQQLFSSQAKKRGLRPPKGCCLWGLPGTGKSLVGKMMSWKLGATLVSCSWNQLIGSDLSESLGNLQYILDTVDNMGNCVLFFDEFEKAFSGWNSGANGGVLAKMAGMLLSWMQDHTSPVIMLATINHLDMLPPELIRRFEYIWFFDVILHNGAMQEVFALHLEKNFSQLHEEFSESMWYGLFGEYRGCSPAEIAGAVKRVHDELFFRLGDGVELLTSKELWEEILAERTRFRPALVNKSTANQLAKIMMEADFARKVRGEHTSRFARPPRELFEPEPVKEVEITHAEGNRILSFSMKDYTSPI